MMFVGYADQEKISDRMWDSRSMRVIVTRDVTWLKRMFFKNDMSSISLEEIGDGLARVRVEK